MCTLSLCFFPKKISVIIPALAMIEEHYYGKEYFPRWKDYVLQFCEKLHSEDIEKEFEDPHSDLPIKAWNYFVKTKLNDIDIFVPRYIDIFYRSGQSFRGWNFENMTYQENMFLDYVQRKLKVIAKDFVPKSC